jgi:hypothetical protein
VTRLRSRAGALAVSTLLAVACNHDAPAGAASDRPSEAQSPATSATSVASSATSAIPAAGSVMVGSQSFSLTGPPMVAADYTRLADALGTIEHDAFPKRTDTLFAHMVAKENYAFLTREDQPIPPRFKGGWELAGAINQVNKRYLQALLKGRLMRENLELQAMAGCIAGQMVPVTQAFTASLDKSDPKYPVRMKGLEQIKVGLDEIVRGALMTLASGGFDVGDRRWFAATLLPCAAPILGFLSDDNRIARRAEAKAMAGKEDDPEIRAALSSFGSAK